METNAVLAKIALQTLALMELCVCQKFVRPVPLIQIKLIRVHLENFARLDSLNRLLTPLVYAMLRNA